METDTTLAQHGRIMEPVLSFWERYRRRWLTVSVICGVLVMVFGAAAAQREGWSVVTYALSGGLTGGHLHGIGPHAPGRGISKETANQEVVVSPAGVLVAEEDKCVRNCRGAGAFGGAPVGFLQRMEGFTEQPSDDRDPQSSGQSAPEVS